MTTLNEAWGTVTFPAVNIDGTHTWSIVSGGAAGGYLSVRSAGFATALGDAGTTVEALARCDQTLAGVDMTVSATISPLDTAGGQVRMGPCARFAVSATTFYAWVADWNINQFLLLKYVAGVPGALGTTPTFAATVTPVAGDVLTLEVTGGATTYLVCKVNGATLDTVDDSSSPLDTATRGGLLLLVNRFNEQLNGLTAWTAADLVGTPARSYVVGGGVGGRGAVIG